MNDKANIMKNEIRQISKFRGLLFSKYYLCFVLSVITFISGIYKFPLTPLYVLLFLILLPPIIAFTLKDYSQKSSNKILLRLLFEETYMLNNLRKKYKFSKIGYFVNQCAYLISMLLICLWQISFKHLSITNSLIEKLPFLLLITGLIIRYLAVIIYRIKLPYDLMHNKV